MKAVYTEEDYKVLVEVLEDSSDEEWERFELKAIKTLRHSKIFKPIEDGEVWSVSSNRDYPCYKLWDLEIKEEPKPEGPKL